MIYIILNIFVPVHPVADRLFGGGDCSVPAAGRKQQSKGCARVGWSILWSALSLPAGGSYMRKDRDLQCQSVARPRESYDLEWRQQKYI